MLSISTVYASNDTFTDLENMIYDSNEDTIILNND